jgi:DNA-binding PadR family transcriptional regulator
MTEMRDEKALKLLPLKPMVFQIILILSDAERHGWSIVKELEKRLDGQTKILPGNLYRTLRTMLSEGLIEESDERPDPEIDDERRRYFRLSDFGAEVGRAEARRLEGLVQLARSKKLLSSAGTRS